MVAPHRYLGVSLVVFFLCRLLYGAIPRSKLFVIGPLANVKSQPEQLHALNRVHIEAAKMIMDVLKNRKPNEAAYYADYVSVLMNEPYGGIRNMHRCTNNLMTFAADLYFDLWYNQSRISEINLVACESGAYLAIKLMQFIDLYGDSFVRSVSSFNIVWTWFENLKNMPLLCCLYLIYASVVILIDPSLTAPRRMAKWLGYRSAMYDERKLVAPKGDSRLCLVLRTGFVTATHFDLEVEGAENFSDDGVTAVVERFKNFINR
ncbi:uncharacterized protein LACBIDRAFT_326330 [Laccaria bicolor S238N-H82]|uniref:Predicted protein n=1 Tax=Laccaria bicolor (strain S238N-H82 / ATCC MYA-4686) TaxID=486041 RepID=B0D869_LACBS|nr:uncharacterized protein LACBIDRAFT_326330 [Laccaria bicolor S238N-H82]EDR09028.1 predicted protein [Laccaria bicolor S238N-H82]|eukprot:XP_001880341.1 predicted protein [Laccaria bicolor S238N-H82]